MAPPNPPGFSTPYCTSQRYALSVRQDAGLARRLVGGESTATQPLSLRTRGDSP